MNLQDASLHQEGRLTEQLQQAREELASTEARWLSAIANLKVVSGACWVSVIVNLKVLVRGIRWLSARR